jgi:FlaA1/EpsC-like NDP-sugar epimerase
MAETILVTGATGTVEGEIVRQLERVTSDVNIKASGYSLQKFEKVIETDRKIYADRS